MAIQSVPMPFFRHPLRNSEALSLHAARALPSAVLTRIEDVRRDPCNRGPLRAVVVAQPGAEPPNQQAADAARAPDVPLAGSAATRAGGSKLTHANLPPVISTLVLVAAIFWLASALEYAVHHMTRAT
ncbi:hypothetical protein ABPG77_001633 [Micractinium sp. CCAP 211/92]